MFGFQPSGQQPQPQPQPQPQVNLRETDALTELCHLAEAVLPLPENKEYRLKRIFVDTNAERRDPTSVPVLTPHEHVQVRHQAQRMGITAENWLPTAAVGFTGLKERFTAQKKAIEEQEAMIKAMKQRLTREGISYRKNCADRLQKWSKLMRQTETELLKLFKTAEECATRQAIVQGKTGSSKSSLGKVTDEVQAVQREIRNQNLRTRVLAVEQDMYMQGVQQRDRTAREPAKDVEEKRLLLRQSRDKMSQVQAKLEACERDVNVMKRGRLPMQQNGHHH